MDDAYRSVRLALTEFSRFQGSVGEIKGIGTR